MPIESVSSTASAIKTYASEDAQRRRPEEELQATNQQAPKREDVKLSDQARQLASQPQTDESERNDTVQNSADASQQARGAVAVAIAAYQQAGQV